MTSKVCVVDYWRNDVPVAPELILDAPNNKEFIIPLREFIIQGARDFKTSVSPSEGVLDKVPAQRGWRLRPIIVSEPIHGRVTLSADGESFIYKALDGYVGMDCFSYAVTNGFQQSRIGSITINSQRGYDYSLKVYRRNVAKTQHRMVVAPAFDFSELELPPVRQVFAKWYYNQYVAEQEGKITRIKKQRKLIAQTQWNRFYYDQVQAFAPTITNAALTVTANTYFEDTLPNGLLEETSRIFAPKHLAGDIEIELQLFTKTKLTPLPNNPNATMLQLDLDDYLSVNFTVVERYGIRWTESGNILV